MAENEDPQDQAAPEEATPAPEPEAAAPAPKEGSEPLGKLLQREEEFHAGERFLGVFHSPNRVFNHVYAAESWGFPFLVLVLVWGLALGVYSLRMDWVGFLEPWAELVGRELPESVAEAFQGRWGVLIKAGAAVALVACWVILPLFVVGLVYFALFRVLGKDLTFRHSMGVVCYAKLVGVIPAGLMIIMAVGRSPEMLNILNPLPTNAAFFLSDLHPGWVALWAQLDLFTLWGLILMTLGYAIVAGATRPVSFLAVFLPWIILVGGLSVLAGATGAAPGS